MKAIFFLVCMCLFFIFGMFYGIDKDVNKSGYDQETVYNTPMTDVSPIDEDELSRVQIKELQIVNHENVGDIQEETYKVYDIASYMESVVKAFFSRLLDILYGITNPF